MSFDHPLTYPVIDRYIKEAKENIKEYLKNIVYELSPLFYEVEDQRDSIVETWANEIYGDLEAIFENARSTNSDMRVSAESQIGELERKIDDLEYYVNDLEVTIKTKDNKIENNALKNNRKLKYSQTFS